jgi:hypothetical protein
MRRSVAWLDLARVVKRGTESTGVGWSRWVRTPRLGEDGARVGEEAARVGERVAASQGGSHDRASG